MGNFTENNKELVKISFVGDIMCELPLLKASKIGTSVYDFDKVFKNVKGLIQESDYVVGNLETICAGEKFGLTNDLFSFNSPQSFVKSLKNSGINMVTTATNHSLDRGIEGLLENLNVLDSYNMKNIGTYRNQLERDRIFIEKFNDISIAFLNYTYGTNAHINGVELKSDEKFHVNLMKSQKKELDRYNRYNRSRNIKRIIARGFFKIIPLHKWISLKKKLGLKYNTAFQDNDLDELDAEYLQQIKQDITKAKNQADIVIMCMHSGGQFHPEPGQYSKYMMNFMDENGVDVVIGNHPHVVQKFEVFNNGMYGAYSLGNFSISPSSAYVLPDHLPEYSIMLHIYLSKLEKKIKKIGFSILKIIESKDGSIEVYPIDELFYQENFETKEQLEKDITTIYNTFTGLNRKIINIKREYTY